jgi:transposase
MERLRYYTDEFKQNVVNEVLDGLISQAEARRRYGIKGKSAILNWIRKFDGSNLIGMKPKKKTEDVIKSTEELEAENRRLRQELELEKLRSKALNVMIDIAEDKFKIPIRKKHGARQSKKQPAQKKGSVLIHSVGCLAKHDRHTISGRNRYTKKE